MRRIAQAAGDAPTVYGLAGTGSRVAKKRRSAGYTSDLSEIVTAINFLSCILLKADINVLGER